MTRRTLVIEFNDAEGIPADSALLFAIEEGLQRHGYDDLGLALMPPTALPVACDKCQGTGRDTESRICIGIGTPSSGVPINVAKAVQAPLLLDARETGELFEFLRCKKCEGKGFCLTQEAASA